MEGLPKHERGLSLEQIRNPLDLVAEAVEKIQKKGIIAYGEAEHNGSGTLEYETTLIKELSERGYKIQKVFLEEAEWWMPHVEQFYATGKMSETLIEYLTHQFVRLDSWGGYDYKVEFLETCRELNIPVRFIDNATVTDRDADWMEKMDSEIGETPSGLYILIAGTTHVSHSPKISVDSPVVSRLDKKYPGAVISIASATTEVIHNSPGFVVYNRFLQDLEHYGVASQPSAVSMKESPYRDMRLRESKVGDKYADVNASEAFDVLMIVPGQDLRKNK